MRLEIPDLAAARADLGVTWRSRPSSSTTNSSPATSCATCSTQAGGVDGRGPGRQRRRGPGLIDELKPDLVFLDVQMPGYVRSGFEVSRGRRHARRARRRGAEIVFVTAFDQYAIEAFQVERRRLPAQAGRPRAARPGGRSGPGGGSGRGRRAAGRRGRPATLANAELERHRQTRARAPGPARAAGGEGRRAVLAGRRRRRDFRDAGRRCGDGRGHGVDGNVELPDARRTPGAARSGDVLAGASGILW